MQAFIVRPFGLKSGIDFERIHNELVAPALKAADIHGGTTGTILEAGNIREDMFQLLLVADLVIADISIHNANVFYELGIRHAVRARQTYLIRAKMSNPPNQRGPEGDVPFDLKTDRYLEYDPSDPAAALAMFVQGLNETKASDRVDSPVFRSLPGLDEPEQSKLNPVPLAFVNDADLAASRGQGGKLGLLGRESGRFLWELGGRRIVGRRQLHCGFLTSARNTWEVVTNAYPHDVEANLILGTVYQRLQDLTRSDQSCRCVLENPRASLDERAEALALQGRNEKARGRGLWRGKNEDERRISAIRSRFFFESLKLYERGFEQNLNHTYSGLNALALSRLLLELIRQNHDEWVDMFDIESKALRTEDELKVSYDRLAAAVGMSLQAATTKGNNQDIWLAISKADYAFLTAARDGAAAAAYERALSGAEPFHVAAARDQLDLFRQLGIFKDRVELSLARFPAVPLPAETLRHVIIFSGHMVDKPDREDPRFPASEELRAREAIRNAIQQSLESLPGPALGVAGGANGGDISFHEVCSELGIPTRVLLSLPEGPFVAESVAHGGPAWIKRFNALTDTHRGVNELQVLGPGKELPSWMRKLAGYDIWQRTNLWLLEEALATGAPNISLIALWDGKNADGPGGTKDLIDLAHDHGVNTTVLITSNIFATKPG